MRALLPLLLLSGLCASPAGAFLFGRAAEDKAAAMLARMRTAFEGGDCAAVMEISSGFLTEKPSASLREEGYGYMGGCYESEGLTDKAISLYKLALGLYPENILFAARLAAIYNQAGFPADAVPLFLKVLAVKTDDLEANLGLARAYSELGFLSRAGEFYSRTVILQDFRDEAVLKEYAGCMLRKRDWAEALFIAGKGAQAAPRSAFWPRTEARVRAGQGDYSKAVARIEAALRFNSSRQLRLERALYLLLGGLPRRAIEAADAELAADRSDPLASVVKGMALYSMGRKDEAAGYFAAGGGGGPFTARIAASFLAADLKKTEGTCKN